MKISESPANIPLELRSLVKWSVTLLGQAIEEELGRAAYDKIERIRKRMSGLKSAAETTKLHELQRTLIDLKKLEPEERFDFARSFTLMLELINACENAYRTWRLRQKGGPNVEPSKNAIYSVMTAHPTEARSPKNIAIFHEIQKELIASLTKGQLRSEEKLKGLIQLAWKTPIVREKKPTVKDEAEHIYSIMLRPENLDSFLDLSRTIAPIHLRTWVGGDKDGHPGVDAEAMMTSLQLSRTRILAYLNTQLQLIQVHATHSTVITEIEKTHSLAASITELKAKDSTLTQKLQGQIDQLIQAFQKHYGKYPSPALLRLDQLRILFPGFVVPLELREDSALLETDPKTGKSLAIGKMLDQLKILGTPLNYARGLIISMCESAAHIQTGLSIVQSRLGSDDFPVVPLFENKKALTQAPEILKELFEDSAVLDMIQKKWDGLFEVMVGYSDSSKESGVLASRLMVSQAMVAIETACKPFQVTPVFFNGSGGSISRGGGSVRDQLSSLPKSALERYKATIQGEMVERNFSSPEILESQLLKIVEIARGFKTLWKPLKPNMGLEKLAELTALSYQEQVKDPEFLAMIEAATPYPFLSALQIGSRPSKRSGTVSLDSLRAIPWILCWTQTRVLFPTWWGVGTAWKALDPREQAQVKIAFRQNGMFRSYMSALGFTLKKIELSVFDLYLNQSQLSSSQKHTIKRQLQIERSKTLRFFKEVTGQSNLLWTRPWLGESIELRAPMIHPLNCLQILAQQEDDLKLLRVCVTGIASGMLTTG